MGFVCEVEGSTSSHGEQELVDNKAFTDAFEAGLQRREGAENPTLEKVS